MNTNKTQIQSSVVLCPKSNHCWLHRGSTVPSGNGMGSFQLGTTLCPVDSVLFNSEDSIFFIFSWKCYYSTMKCSFLERFEDVSGPNVLRRLWSFLIRLIIKSVVLTVLAHSDCKWKTKRPDKLSSDPQYTSTGPSTNKIVNNQKLSDSSTCRLRNTAVNHNS